MKTITDTRWQFEFDVGGKPYVLTVTDERAANYLAELERNAKQLDKLIEFVMGIAPSGCVPVWLGDHWEFRGTGCLR